MANAAIKVLEREQRAAGMSDEEFARALGISRGHWNMVRNGHRPLSVALAAWALRQFPAARAELIGFIEAEPLTA